MTAETPQDVHDLFARAFAAADLDAVMELYEPDAILVQQDGNVARGHDEIREALSKFLALRPRFSLRVEQVFAAAGLAILFSRWTINGTGPQGEEINLTGRTSDVVRRQDDGHWLIAIDSPYGGEPA